MAADDGVLKAAYYDWILDLHLPIADVDADFGATFPVESQAAPSESFNLDRFVIEAKKRESTWDLFVGVTPFLEMIALVESGTIEPWDPYLPPGLLADLPPAIAAEGSHDGKFYVWPFLLDVIVQGWNAGIVAEAGLDPEAAPRTWDEYLANARMVKERGAAPFGCTYDVLAWRSLIPITHSISTDVYTADGTFRWTSDAAVEALEIMRRMTELAHPDVTAGWSPGSSATPDELVFAGEQAAYAIKYQNAPLHMAGAWPDPAALRLSALPVQEGGAGGTVFWNTGAVLLKYGKNKEWAARYVQALTADQRIWQRSIAGDPSTQEPPIGQLPASLSIWADYRANPPQWLTDPAWAFDVWDGLGRATAIRPTKLSVTQYDVAMPYYVDYLDGNERDARTAMQKAQDAVDKELERYA